MPGGDGTGPTGGSSDGRRGQGRGFGGPTGHCICPQCGHVQAHLRGTPCSQLACPKCGAMMTRQQDTSRT
ncbi:hypothetical protein EH223_19170 [candidate division KSB1 bacterium]|nr:MAG: hypothetical protein EH223_19170 [candidate division KSB1 bacterium]